MIVAVSRAPLPRRIIADTRICEQSRGKQGTSRLKAQSDTFNQSAYMARDSKKRGMDTEPTRSQKAAMGACVAGPDAEMAMRSRGSSDALLLMARPPRGQSRISTGCAPRRVAWIRWPISCTRTVPKRSGPVATNVKKTPANVPPCRAVDTQAMAGTAPRRMWARSGTCSPLPPKQRGRVTEPTSQDWPVIDEADAREERGVVAIM
mmetsp:Transcript_5388/g.17673  ORF Transcript_5388/g.17673 Transcript_5388/m.17673 type:complete len:206 (-) Transcript_5388:202-819(-)